MVLLTVFMGILFLAIVALGLFLWMHGAGRAFLLRAMSKFRFSLRTLLLGTLALGALGAVWIHWSPFEPTGYTMDMGGLEVTQSTIEFSPDGQRLLFLTQNGVWLWDFKTDPKLLKTKPALNYANGARFSADGASVIAFNHDKIVRFTLADDTQTLIADFAVQLNKKGDDVFQGIRVLTVSNNAQYALVEESTQMRTASGGIGTLSNKPRFIQIRDCAESKVLASFPSDSWAANVASISADGRRCCWFASDTGFTALTMFDAETKQVTSLRPQALHVFQGKLTLTNDGSTTAYACIDQSVEVVDLERMRVLERVGVPDVQAAFLSPDGKRLATVHDLKSITIWDTRRKPGAFGPLDFPELWLAAVFGAIFLASLIGDLFSLRRSRLQALRPAEVARSAQLTNPPPALSPNGAE